MTEQDDQESHRKWMETLLNSLPAAVIVVELGTARILYANATALVAIVPEATPGTIEENASAFPLYESRWREGLFDGMGRQLTPDKFPSKRVARGETFAGYEVHWKCPIRGITHAFLCSGAILPPAHGRPAKGLLTFVEVTDRVHQREQLQQAIAIREEFLSVAAHELRTPITSILLQTQSLQQRMRRDELTKEDITTRLNTIERAGRKLSSLVQALLDVTRLARPAALQVSEMNLCDVIRELTARQEIEARRQGIQILLDIPEYTIRGYWDPLKLDQIIGNLISNAIKYGDHKPIEITVEHSDGFAILDVRDHGIGVPPKDRERIFQRFERAVTSDQYPGMGLGLWLAAQAAREMHGNIELIIPPDGSGSIFRLTLPIDHIEERQE